MTIFSHPIICEKEVDPEFLPFNFKTFEERLGIHSGNANDTLPILALPSSTETQQSWFYRKSWHLNDDYNCSMMHWYSFEQGNPQGDVGDWYSLLGQWACQHQGASVPALSSTNKRFPTLFIFENAKGNIGTSELPLFFSFDFLFSVRRSPSWFPLQPLSLLPT